MSLCVCECECACECVWRGLLPQGPRGRVLQRAGRRPLFIRIPQSSGDHLGPWASPWEPRSPPDALADEQQVAVGEEGKERPAGGPVGRVQPLSVHGRRECSETSVCLLGADAVLGAGAGHHRVSIQGHVKGYRVLRQLGDGAPQESMGGWGAAWMGGQGGK